MFIYIYNWKTESALITIYAEKLSKSRNLQIMMDFLPLSAIRDVSNRSKLCPAQKYGKTSNEFPVDS